LKNKEDILEDFRIRSSNVVLNNNVNPNLLGKNQNTYISNMGITSEIDPLNGHNSLGNPKRISRLVAKIFGSLSSKITSLRNESEKGFSYGIFIDGLGWRVTVRTGKEVPGGEKVSIQVEKPGQSRTSPNLPLGLKVSETDTFLEFKVGHSHYKHIRLPDN